MDIGWLGRFHAGKFKSIECGGAVVKKQKVRSVALGMSRIDAFIFAIEDPKAIEDGRHSWHTRRLGEWCENCLAVVQRNTQERPGIGRARASVDAIPAIDEELAPGARRHERPGFGALRIAAGCRIEGINFGQTGWAAEHRTACSNFVIARGCRRGQILLVVENRWPTIVGYGTLSRVVFRWDEPLLTVIGINS